MDQESYHKKRKNVALAEGLVSFVSMGAGPPAVFIHGLMLNNAVWRPLINKLRFVRECFAPDLLAHGRTQAAEGQDLSLDSQAEMIANFCRTLGHDKVDIIASDFGGAVAQLFVIKYPKMVRSMSLTNCDVHYNLGPPADLRRIIPLAKDGQLGNLIASMMSNIDLARSQFPGRGFQNPENLKQEDIAELLEPCFGSENGRKQFERFILSLSEDELAKYEPQLKELKTPSLLVWGTEDSYFGLPWAFWLRDTLGGSVTLVEIERGGLFIQMERTHEVSEAINLFWEKQ
ncbi:alpha/beta fold hydrolase [Sphingorhabdus sp. EL138]|uniref:alpha/beta fold hydrolase n=1 Tax=Sphingorhabdus sp. EL138 TaxID=2073156 RepID=UPI000D6A03B4|nr:alpha/beta hydrolase [Sphingorhabdus sp. EL138]